ncbi:hypothetical protein HDU96_006850 [Phlyctochytrium bullatum]|nr:hypothetical protein HDU96_006850 [Phlyctochytrium bullatum]
MAKGEAKKTAKNGKAAKSAPAVEEVPWFASAHDPVARWFELFQKDTDGLLQFRLGPLDKPLQEGLENRGEGPPSPESIVAIDCEMVEVLLPATETEWKEATAKPNKIPGLPSAPPLGKTRSALARVSVVDFNGKVIIDTFSRPDEVVVDFRTQFSGVTALDIENAEQVKKKVTEILKGKVIVGQSLDNDLGVLDIEVPFHHIRDTALYYRRFHPRGKSISLRDLAKLFLNLDIQQGSHDSVIDARVSLLLYRQLRSIWEKSMPIFEYQEPTTYFPVPLSFPVPFRDVMEKIAAWDPEKPLPQLRTLLSGDANGTSSATKPLPVPNAQPFAAPTSLVPSFGTPIHPSPHSRPIALPGQPMGIAIAPIPMISEDKMANTPIVVKKKADLTKTADEEVEPIVPNKSEVVVRAFYNFLPRDQTMFKFKSFPTWLVPKGTLLKAENRVLLADLQRALKSGSQAEKVDTSKPGKRKQKMLEEKAKKAASADDEDDAEPSETPAVNGGLETEDQDHTSPVEHVANGTGKATRKKNASTDKGKRKAPPVEEDAEPERQPSEPPKKKAKAAKVSKNDEAEASTEDSEPAQKKAKGKKKASPAAETEVKAVTETSEPEQKQTKTKSKKKASVDADDESATVEAETSAPPEKQTRKSKRKAEPEVTEAKVVAKTTETKTRKSKRKAEVGEAEPSAAPEPPKKKAKATKAKTAVPEPSEEKIAKASRTKPRKEKSAADSTVAATKKDTPETNARSARAEHRNNVKNSLEAATEAPKPNKKAKARVIPDPEPAEEPKPAPSKRSKAKASAEEVKEAAVMEKVETDAEKVKAKKKAKGKAAEEAAEETEPKTRRAKANQKDEVEAKPENEKVGKKKGKSDTEDGRGKTKKAKK